MKIPFKSNSGLASEQTEHSQVVCRDTFFCCENQINHMEKLQVYRLSN